ncbi:hypothetical protein ASA1KI_18810 [Opitutales bacterium ASA1]|uniref:hypothetical protein n=1 Tax=Congregicoccus parvus TaxID=3081749 RepID=UPI002B27CA99|nr:hypothetical protein ASA1KI_18810 [Opitutales bacterium ASA1]
MIDKQALLASVVAHLQEKLHILSEAKKMANEEALPDEDTSESQRENRALENQYVVDEQDRVANEYKEAILAYEAMTPRTFGPGERAEVGALVELEMGGERSLYLLGPKAGGLDVPINGSIVCVITPQSPLGQRLIGRNTGDVVVVGGGAHGREARVTALG